MINSFRGFEATQAPEVNPTLWGYVIRSERHGTAPAGAGGRARRLSGMMFAALALGLWAWPGSVASPEVLVLKLGATFLFSFLAFLFLRPIARVLIREVQVDTQRGEICLGHRTTRGGFILEGRFGFGEIGAVMLRAVEQEDAAPQLLLRLGHSELAVVVAEGSEAGLRALAWRLGRDLGADTAGFDPLAPQVADPDTPLQLGPAVELLAVA